MAEHEDPASALAEALGQAQAAIDRAADAAGVEPAKSSSGPTMNDAIREGAEQPSSRAKARMAP